MIINMEFGARLSGFLKEYGISQKDFAEKMQLNVVSINYYVNEKRTPGMDFLVRFAQAFPEVDINWFFKDENGKLLVSEPGTNYEFPQDPVLIIENIEKNLAALKAKLSQE